MTETIIENLSGRKLMALVTLLLLCQMTCFLVGGLIAPKPENIQNIVGTVCADTFTMENETKRWFYNRGNGKCQSVSISDVHRRNLSVTDLVYVFQMPFARESTVSEFLRWQQSLIGVLQIDVKNHYRMKNQSVVAIDARLAYRDKGDPDEEWKLYAESVEKRNIECEAKDDSYENITKCEAVPLFELNSLPHEYYLLNIRLLKDESEKTVQDRVQEIRLAAISQNETYTKVWVSLKTVFFFSFIVTICWFYRRIRILKRKLHLFETMLISLGITTCSLNLPLEYLLLVVNMPLMLLLADIRQFVFYVKLFSLWLFLFGEHMLIQAETSFKKYWRHFLAVFLGCIVIFIFDIYERGMQLKRPFYSIWVTDLWSNSSLGLTFLIISRILLGIYFLFLCYSVWQVFSDIHRKRRKYLPPMSYMRRLGYEGLYERIIFRLKLLMMVSMVCAALTLTNIILGQVADWKINENVKLEYTSAFFTGVYGMWNLYILALLVLYAPSQKQWDNVADNYASLNGNIECEDKE